MFGDVRMDFCESITNISPQGFFKYGFDPPFVGTSWVWKIMGENNCLIHSTVLIHTKSIFSIWSHTNMLNQTTLLSIMTWTLDVVCSLSVFHSQAKIFGTHANVI